MFWNMSIFTAAAVAAAILGQPSASAHDGPCGATAADSNYPSKYSFPAYVERYPAYSPSFHSTAAACPCISGIPPAGNCISGRGCTDDSVFPSQNHHSHLDVFPPVSSPHYGQPQPQPRGEEPSGQPREFIGPPPPVGSQNLPTHSPQSSRAPALPNGVEGIARLPQDEQAVALHQKTCPVTSELLGSMGQPIRISVDGRSVFVCCEGCGERLRRNPAQYLHNAFQTRPGTMR